MYVRCIFINIFWWYSLISCAQIGENFNDGNITSNPVWSGNTQHFIVNSDFQLQLNAVEAGESFIYTAYNLLQDSLEIDLYFKMTFDPSDNNFTNVYLAMDNPDVSVATGYYLKLGENGSADNIKLFKLETGNSTLLASGTMGAISKDPAQGRVKIRISKQGMWLVETNYSGGDVLVADFEVMDNSIFNLPSMVYFGIYCKYTSSRLKNFFYDDISVKRWEKDTIPPQLITARVLDENHVELTFNEKIESTTGLNLISYQVDNNLGLPVEVVYGTGENMVILEFANKILSGVEYTIMINGVKDLSGNVLIGETLFSYAIKPEYRDIVINEILTDPFVGGEDFIELLNISSKYIQLKDLVIRNHSRNEEVIILNEFILKPGDYVAISKNTGFLSQQYDTPAEAQFLTTTLPALNVSDAHVQILTRNGSETVLIDEFSYQEDYHFALLNNTKGVSLERILPEGESNDFNNWHSASQEVGFATPGYKNSNLVDPSNISEEEVTIKNKVFSPYAADFDHFLLMEYNLEKGGYLATIQIFDIEGFLIRSLHKNLLLGTQGVLKWDGFNDENNPVKMGWYIIATELFHPDGAVKTFKHSVVVGDKL